MKAINKILSLVNELEYEELESLYRTILQRLKHKRKIANMNLASQFNIGDKVKLKAQYQSKKPYDAFGKVKKINTSRLSIDFDNMGTWRVPASMLEAV